MIARARLTAPGATCLFLLAVLAAGCDSSTDTPTSPGGTLQVVAPRATLRAGETVPLTAASGGAPVAGLTWVSTDTTVVAVSAAGQATAGRPGRATVTASSGTASGSVALRVVPDYNGTWRGGASRIQLACNPASTTPICAPGAATGGTITLSVTQVGDLLTGTLVDSAEPTATVPLTGQVAADDQLALAGRIDVPTTTPTLRVEVSTLRGTIDPILGTMTGSYGLFVDRARTGGNLQDDYRTQVQFRDMRRQ